MRSIEERENIAVDLAIEHIEDEIMSDVINESAQEHALAHAKQVQAQQAQMHQAQQAQQDQQAYAQAHAHATRALFSEPSLEEIATPPATPAKVLVP